MKLVLGKLVGSVQDLEHKHHPFRPQLSVCAEEVVDAVVSVIVETVAASAFVRASVVEVEGVVVGFVESAVEARKAVVVAVAVATSAVAAVKLLVAAEVVVACEEVVAAACCCNCGRCCC